MGKKRKSAYEYNYFDSTRTILAGRSVCADKRRPANEDYLHRPDLPVIGNDFVLMVRRLADRGICRAQIADRLRCNLRDVFRVLEGEEYLRRFALEIDDLHPLTIRQKTIVETIRSGKAESVTQLLQEFSSSQAELWHIAEIGGVEKQFRDMFNPDGDPKKLKEELRLKITWMLQRTVYSQETIAKRYGVSRWVVYNIGVSGKIHRQYRRGDSRRRMTEKQIGEVIALAKQGLSQVELSRRFGFTRDTIRAIERRAGYKRQIRRPIGGKLLVRAG